MMADTPCLTCSYPAACGESCAADWVEEYATWRYWERQALNPHQTVYDEAEGALRPFREDEGG
ncbi:MAG TPA: hypothetical protein VJA25_03755, partial [Dehalococcoidia bacterium]|nr:hypothetical protein [Dehalococcoidia bacterium]